MLLKRGGGEGRVEVRGGKLGCGQQFAGFYVVVELRISELEQLELVLRCPSEIRNSTTT